MTEYWPINVWGKSHSLLYKYAPKSFWEDHELYRWKDSKLEVLTSATSHISDASYMEQIEKNYNKQIKAFWLLLLLYSKYIFMIHDLFWKCVHHETHIQDIQKQHTYYCYDHLSKHLNITFFSHFLRCCVADTMFIECCFCSF